MGLSAARYGEGDGVPCPRNRVDSEATHGRASSDIEFPEAEWAPGTAPEGAVGVASALTPASSSAETDPYEAYIHRGLAAGGFVQPGSIWTPEHLREGRASPKGAG